MPEGHTIHRLAAALDELYGGQKLHTSSPQGRFADGASRLDGQVLLGSQAHGKHLFLPFGARADVPVDDESVTWLRIHLGLYGSWTFDGDREFTAPSVRPAGASASVVSTPSRAGEDLPWPGWVAGLTTSPTDGKGRKGTPPVMTVRVLTSGSRPSRAVRCDYASLAGTVWPT